MQETKFWKTIFEGLKFCFRKYKYTHVANTHNIMTHVEYNFCNMRFFLSLDRPKILQKWTSLELYSDDNKVASEKSRCSFKVCKQLTKYTINFVKIGWFFINKEKESDFFGPPLLSRWTLQKTLSNEIQYFRGVGECFTVFEWRLISFSREKTNYQQVLKPF